MEFITKRQDSVLTIEGGHKFDDILKACDAFRRARITVESYSEKAQISVQQIRWLKGVLLPALADETGYTKLWWENWLKLEVMPEEFKPEKVTVGDVEYAVIPSISTLSIKKTNDFIEGIVEKLHENGFHWVTLPNPELKKT